MVFFCFVCVVYFLYLAQICIHNLLLSTIANFFCLAFVHPQTDAEILLNTFVVYDLFAFKFLLKFLCFIIKRWEDCNGLLQYSVTSYNSLNRFFQIILTNHRLKILIPKFMKCYLFSRSSYKLFSYQKKSLNTEYETKNDIPFMNYKSH